MTISINQQVDYLWKKLGYGLTKTSPSNIKNASNESIPSPLFMPGDQIWMQSQQIPYILPAVDTLIVKVYSDDLATAIRCDADITSPLNRTWLTNLTDWIPPTVGPTYQPKVYLDDTSSTTPQTTGIQLYANGANNDDEWFFDFQSGVLHFIGTNLPAQDFTGKSIFVCGARYIGSKGFSSLPGSSFGDISIDGNTISSTTSIHLDPQSGLISANDHIISNVAYPLVPTDVATVQYVLDHTSNISANAISQGDSIVAVNDAGIGNVTVTVDGTLTSTWSSGTFTTGNVTTAGSTISSSASLIFAPSSGITSVATTGALQVSVGTTAQRPIAPAAGYVRFNLDTGVLECYNGTEWISSQATVSSQIIPGDGVTATFTLDKSSDANGIMAMINGVVQIPNVAYQITGTQITFAEPPTPVDTIEIRYIGQLVSSKSTMPNPVIVDTSNVPVSTTGSIIDMFSAVAYRTAKYCFSVNTGDGHFQTFDATVVQNGTVVSVLKSTVNTTGGTEAVTISATLSSNNVTVTATATHASTVTKVQKTYFTL